MTNKWGCYAFSQKKSFMTNKWGCFTFSQILGKWCQHFGMKIGLKMMVMILEKLGLNWGSKWVSNRTEKILQKVKFQRKLVSCAQPCAWSGARSCAWRSGAQVLPCVAKTFCGSCAWCCAPSGGAQVGAQVGLPVVKFLCCVAREVTR